jgi:hypothetical protein
MPSEFYSGVVTEDDRWYVHPLEIYRTNIIIGALEVGHSVKKIRVKNKHKVNKLKLVKV